MCDGGVVVGFLLDVCCCCYLFFFFFKQKTAYEIGTGDWSSDVCSSDLPSYATTSIQLLAKPVLWPFKIDYPESMS